MKVATTPRTQARNQSQTQAVSEPFPSNEGRYRKDGSQLSIRSLKLVSEPFPSNEGRYAEFPIELTPFFISAVSEPFPSNEGRYPEGEEWKFVKWRFRTFSF